MLLSCVAHGGKRSHREWLWELWLLQSSSEHCGAGWPGGPGLGAHSHLGGEKLHVLSGGGGGKGYDLQRSKGSIQVLNAAAFPGGMLASGLLCSLLSRALVHGIPPLLGVCSE